jgi:hypothetical protein
MPGWIVVVYCYSHSKYKHTMRQSAARQSVVSSRLVIFNENSSESNANKSLYAFNQNSRKYP